ncbi:hypothetical protein QVD17_16484 [Tagetes erecta]|uniref:HAT C-terminal dimerisation domain-containing protein n=1 Tax=Tagetes erecta TaxID=13708 RepID=A0AAD8P0R4_TARER|nr:hypothetical protein QVD17_16484 [Tagetes erecta]
MEKFLKRKAPFPSENASTSIPKPISTPSMPKFVDLDNLPWDPYSKTSYYLVYRLLKLALVLPFATATVERCFSAMKRVKSSFRNRIGDEFLNACVICAVEVDELSDVTNEDVIERFKKMKTRRGQL